jgi:hypothetical protein
MNVGTVLETKEFDKIAFDTCCFIDNKVVGPAYAMLKLHPEVYMEVNLLAIH